MGRKTLIIGLAVIAISSSVGWWSASIRNVDVSVPSEFVGQHCSMRIREGTNYDGVRYYVRRYSCRIISSNEDWTVINGIMSSNESEKEKRYHAVRTKDIESISIERHPE